jgi:glycosyltransferase involved in cell wall biosynthesis
VPRVAIDTTALLDVRTGVGALVAALVDRVGRDDDLELVAFGFTRIYLAELASQLPPHTTCIRRPIPARTTRRLWLRTNHPTIERWTGPIDVVHGPNFVVPPARKAAELLTIHDLTCVRFPELCDANTVQYPRLIRRALGRGAHVHVVSEFVANEVAAEFGVPSDRVHVIPNGVSDISGGVAARGRELAGGDRYVLALGTVEPRKNFALLVDAFDDLASRDNEVRLVIAGRDGWGADNLRTAVTTARHRDRIRRVGFVDGAARADLMAGAAVLAYPSRYEGFGLPPLEAMSAGVPVVATAVGAIPEVVGDAAYLVPPEQAALADALYETLDDTSLRSLLTTRGRDRVRQFSWDRTASSMAALYRTLARAGV